MREVDALFNQPVVRETPDGLELFATRNGDPEDRLAYFSTVVNGQSVAETLQSKLERAAQPHTTRQATRYSVHGLHEYKGKFNPQVVRALLNILQVPRGARVLDPFCGSGTTLIECAHSEVLGHGVDVNPFAVFLANAKLQALVTPVSELISAQEQLFRSLDLSDTPVGCRDLRADYLRAWFTPDVFETIERLRRVIKKATGPHAPVFLALASNLLRDYSLQDPKDLRMRRRKTPLPSQPFVDALQASNNRFLGHLKATQDILGVSLSRGHAEVQDATKLTQQSDPFDAVITSPPYAMALPYIDTQRLSLVWLGMIEPSDVYALDSEMIGSRELTKKELCATSAALIENAECLPESEATFCLQLHNALSPVDGFRRQAVPSLMYRYLVLMRDCLRSIRGIVRSGAPFALIVGHNHTVLGGDRIDIDTPAHIASMADSVGWVVNELLPLQSYRRYGYHTRNAVRNETLILLCNP